MFDTGDSPAEKREQQDFLLRLIRQTIRAVAACARLRETGRHEASLAELQEAYRELLDIDPAVLQLLGRRPMLHFFGARGQLEPLGLLLWEEAQLRHDLGETQLAHRLRRRAVAVLREARKHLRIGAEAAAILREA